MKSSSDGGDSGSKKFELGCGGVWRSLCLAGVSSLESGGRFCVILYCVIFYNNRIIHISHINCDRIISNICQDGPKT
jgi:hypothetical protein